MALWDNNLSGSVPRELDNLAKLAYVQLSGNQLSGPGSDLAGGQVLPFLLCNSGLSAPTMVP
jgi:hypothetical protein